MLKSRLSLAVLAALALSAAPAFAAEYLVRVQQVPDLKAVYGKVESRDIVAARARIGGTLAEVSVTEGSAVKAGDVIALVVDDKLALQLDALDSQLKGLQAQLDNAVVDLQRGKALAASGTIPRASLDKLQTQVDVLTNQVSSTQSNRAVVTQQATEGRVLAPSAGRVLTIPSPKGTVIMPGEPVARIASGAYFIRLSLPERHAALLKEGDTVEIGARGLQPAASIGQPLRRGRIVKVYPEIEGGRVAADVEVDALGDYFVGERTLVMVPTDVRAVITLPPQAVTNRYGVDYVKLMNGNGPVDVPVIIGSMMNTPDGKMLEIISGLHDGDRVVLP
ncbi:MAG TPA: efflux RND transporter periplasmic adaptor subunit [Aestuariivirga sp.]|jgi:RND family efflux transporter MFP subunit|nr:efflux RND transporter periplasmic adaptor subunit [Aestuariivirga sp.]